MCKVTLLADRGFADRKLLAYLEAIGWSYAIRFRQVIHVTHEGETRKAAGSELLVHTPEEMVGMPLHMLIPEDEAPRLAKASEFLLARAAGHVHPGHQARRREGGGPRALHLARSCGGARRGARRREPRGRHHVPLHAADGASTRGACVTPRGSRNGVRRVQCSFCPPSRRRRAGAAREVRFIAPHPPLGRGAPARSRCRSGPARSGLWRWRA